MPDDLRPDVDEIGAPPLPLWMRAWNRAWAWVERNAPDLTAVFDNDGDLTQLRSLLDDPGASQVWRAVEAAPATLRPSAHAAAVELAKMGVAADVIVGGALPAVLDLLERPSPTDAWRLAVKVGALTSWYDLDAVGARRTASLLRLLGAVS